MEHIRNNILGLIVPALVLVITLLPQTDSWTTPPALNPFNKTPEVREGVVPGYVETSDGRMVTGVVYMTRGKLLKIEDREIKRQRLIPLSVVEQIRCDVKREWMEKEWRFKEKANDEKYFTGRSYPVRVYEHTVTLKDGRKITGALSGILYVKKESSNATESGTRNSDTMPERFLLHKRDKGKFGEDLKFLTYTKLVKLGHNTLKEIQPRH